VSLPCPTVAGVRAAVVPSPGGPDSFVVQDVPEPVPGPGEVVVEVAAAGVNRADLLQRQGRYAGPSGTPPWPGLECSGTVVAVGEGVEGFRGGERVCALLDGGGYAERVAVRAGLVMPVPVGVDLFAAAALPEAAATVHSNVVATAGLRAGETFLVHGATSGIGTFATQLARALGARAVATAGSPAKVAAAAPFGAELVLDYRADDLLERVRAFTDGAGVDVVLDPVGAKYLGLHVELLATGGRLVVIGLMGGRSAELDLATLMTKRAHMHGSTLRARPWRQKADICARVVAEVWPLVADGQVRPVVDRVLPLEQAGEAHRVLEAGEHVGKVLLQP
jgi:putative PIG3 family NAD(P)H quinone oxidoreductase